MDKEKTSYTEDSLVWDNRSRIVALEGSINYIQKSIEGIEKKIDAMNLKMSDYFASREYVDSKVDLLKQEYTPVNEVIKEIGKYIIIGVVGALLGLVLLNK